MTDSDHLGDAPSEGPVDRDRGGIVRPRRTLTAATLRAIRSRDGQGEGEGVMPTVIAVLVMVLVGAGMWLAFENIWGDTADNTVNPAGVIDSDTTGEVGG